MTNYPENIEQKLGFDQLRERIRRYLLSPLGEKWLDEMHFLTDTEKIKMLLQQTGEFITVLEEDLAFPTDHIIDMIPVLKKIRMEGASFTVEELFDLRKSQETIRVIVRFFTRAEEERFPELKILVSGMIVFPYITEAIYKVLTSRGTIRDTASSRLKKIRQSLTIKRKNISGRLRQILKKAQADGWVEKETIFSVRNGRMVIPVPAAYKRQIPGLVLDESATGKTVYIEPAEIVEWNNEIRSLEFAETREIEKILRSLADHFRPYADDLIHSYTLLGVVDFIRAKALLACELGALVPETDNNSEINWRQAVHPLLYLNYKKEGRQVVPLDIHLDSRDRILVISGPNAGGKSVCLQTVGLLQFMFQCGIPVPVAEHSTFGIFRGLFLDFGDEQSIENDLSTYSSRLINMKYFLKHAGPGTLILMDEFGAGTEPMLGGALAEAVLQRLNNTGTFGVVTTHYTNLKHLAASEEGVINGAMLFDNRNMQPLYSLDIGKPGSSFAFEIARKIGMPEEVLREAGEKVGEEHVLFDKHLRDILRDKRYWENKRKKIRQTEKQLESLLEKYETEMAALQKQRKEILAGAQEEADRLLSDVNRKIENAIRIIRETQAEKEHTKQVREELSEMKKNMEEEMQKETTALSRKISSVHARRQRLQRTQTGTQQGNKREDKTIRVGDKVRMAEHDAVGEVLSISRGGYLVAFGNLTTQVVGKKLEKVSEEEYDRYMKQKTNRSVWHETVRDRKLHFRPEIDVRGKRTEEALQEVMAFTDEAIMVGERNLRIIHGKGNGILRQMIREYLQTVGLVLGYHDEHVEQGGAGVTVVELDV